MSLPLSVRYLGTSLSADVVAVKAQEKAHQDQIKPTWQIYYPKADCLIGGHLTS